MPNILIFFHVQALLLSLIDLNEVSRRSSLRHGLSGHENVHKLIMERRREALDDVRKQSTQKGEDVKVELKREQVEEFAPEYRGNWHAQN